jgi:hypothetical protein
MFDEKYYSIYQYFVCVWNIVNVSLVLNKGAFKNDEFFNFRDYGKNRQD